MFKKIEASWNSRTPVWLHPRTKENLIFQLSGAAVILAAYAAYDYYEIRKQDKLRRELTENK